MVRDDSTSIPSAYDSCTSSIDAVRFSSTRDQQEGSYLNFQNGDKFLACAPLDHIGLSERQRDAQTSGITDFVHLHACNEEYMKERPYCATVQYMHKQYNAICELHVASPIIIFNMFW